MQFSVAAFLALAGSAIAQYVEPTPGFNPLTNPTNNEVIPAGKPFTIKWTPQGGNGAPISLYAYAGESASTLQEVGTIATGVDVSLGSYEWSVESSLGGKYKAYGIKIALASDKTVYQWSLPFTISADSSSSSSATSSSSAVSTTASFTSKSSASSTAKTTSTSVTSRSSSAPVTSSTVISSSTSFGNLSTTASTKAPTSQVTLVTSTSTAAGASTTTTRATTTVPTGGAVAKGASSFAVIGGLAMAVLAL